MQLNPVTHAINEFNGWLERHTNRFSTYAMGCEYGDNPVDDSGERISVSVFINNGLCHAYALILRSYLAQQNVEVVLVGSPSHVFLLYEGRYYDAARPNGTPDLTDITRFPKERLIDYQSLATLYREFYNVGEALLEFADLQHTQWASAYAEVNQLIISGV